MLNRYIPGKELFIALVFFTFISASSVAKAEEDFEQMISMVNLMDSFFELMTSVYDMNSNNEKAALLQMHAIEEIYKTQGKPRNAVSVYQDVLKKSKNSTIRNIAYHRMADVLKESGDLDGAIKVLNEALAETLKKTK